MSVKLLQEAFNEVASPAYACEQATMGIDRSHDTEWNVLNFYGTTRDGQPFQAKSPLQRPNSDLILAARETAQALIDRDKTAPQAALPPPEGQS